MKKQVALHSSALVSVFIESFCCLILFRLIIDQLSMVIVKVVRVGSSCTVVDMENFCSPIFITGDAPTSTKPSRYCTLHLTPRLASCFMSEMRRSEPFRSAFLHQLTSEVGGGDASPPVVVKIKLPRDPAAYQDNCINAFWSRRLQFLVNERIELEQLLSWLSTLGGAFSSLGDVFERCVSSSLHQIIRFSTGYKCRRFSKSRWMKVSNGVFRVAKC